MVKEILSDSWESKDFSLLIESLTDADIEAGYVRVDHVFPNLDRRTVPVKQQKTLLLFGEETNRERLDLPGSISMVLDPVFKDPFGPCNKGSPFCMPVVFHNLRREDLVDPEKDIVTERNRFPDFQRGRFSRFDGIFLFSSERSHVSLRTRF